MHHLIFHCFEVLKFDDAPPKFPSFDLKGQCHENFCFRFFHESSSPKPLNNTRVISNFVENSHRYSQVKMDQRHRLLPVLPVLLIPVANLPPVSTTLVTDCHRIIDTVAIDTVSTPLGVNSIPVSITPVANNGNNIRLPEVGGSATCSAMRISATCATRTNAADVRFNPQSADCGIAPAH